MIHESIRDRKSVGIERRPLYPSMIARKSSEPEHSGVSALRQRLGNQGIQQLMREMSGNSTGPKPLHASSIQPKLTISQPGDAHELEADRVANTVMRMTSPSAVGAAAHRSCSACEEEAKEFNVKRRDGTAATPQVTSPLAVNIGAMKGGGIPLAKSSREFFEPRFGADFGQVRVHTDARAANTAKSINAKAFTVGRDIAFGAGQYAPESRGGQRLLVHELAHVVQQRGGPTTVNRDVGDLFDDIGNDIKNFGKGLAKDAEELVRLNLRALGALPGTGPLFSFSDCPKNFCNPFKDVSLAKTMLIAVSPLMLAGIAKKVSSKVVPLWRDYLFGGSSPQNLTMTFGADFTGSKTTKDTADFIVSQLKIEIAANHRKILTSGGPVTLDLTSRMPKTLAAIDTPGNKHEMNFNQIGEVAGNIAGGIGKDQLSHKIGAKPSPFNDDRTATILAELTRTKTGVRVKPNIIFKIHDTIDLCPGNCGAATERDATIPLSRFEATGLSGDVPFEIVFLAPTSSLGAFDIPIASSPGKPKGKSPSKGKGSGKTSGLSDFDIPHEALVLEEFGKDAEGELT